MAVETRYVVIRNGEELNTFMDKKQADLYDQMLNQADALAELISTTELKIDETVKEDLSIFLAQNKDKVLVALGVKKPAKKKPAVVEAPSGDESSSAA